MKWLEKLRQNDPLQKGAGWVFAALIMPLILVAILDDQSEGHLVSKWVYIGLAIPTGLLLILFTLLRVTEPKPIPVVSEDSEADRLRKEAWHKEAAEDRQMALEAEAYLFDLLRRKHVPWEHLRASPMAEDMLGKACLLKTPLILSKQEFDVFSKNDVLTIQSTKNGDTIIVHGVEISSRTLHGYARFFVKSDGSLNS